MIGLLSTICLFGFGGKQEFNSQEVIVGNYTVEILNIANPDPVETKYVVIRRNRSEQSLPTNVTVYDEKDGEILNKYYLNFTDKSNFSIFYDYDLTKPITDIVFTESEKLVARGKVGSKSYKFSILGQNHEIILYDQSNGITKITLVSTRPPPPWFQRYMPVMMLIPMIINIFVSKKMGGMQMAQAQAAQQAQQKENGKKEAKKKEEGKAEEPKAQEPKAEEPKTEEQPASNESKVKTE